MKKITLAVIIAISPTLILSGCTVNPYTNESQASDASIGAAAGALLGAGIGALSSSKKDRGKGAIIGAAAGVALGSGVGYYMDTQEAKLREKMRGTGVSVTRKGNQIILNMPNNVTFNTNSSVIKPAGANTLSGVVLVLKEYDKTGIQVIGHTDNTGSDEINNRLSKERADNVASTLINQGIAANRIGIIGAGSKSPIADNSSATGRAENRRVEIILTPL